MKKWSIKSANFLWFIGIYALSVLGIFLISGLIHVLIFLLKA